MPRVTFNRLSKKKSSVRRRRTSVTTRSKFAPRTAKANRSLIKGNAYAIRALKKLMPPAVYTDFQYTGSQVPFFPLAPNPYFTIDVVPLMTPQAWTAVLRQDQNVMESSTTCIKRMQLNLRYTLAASEYVQITTFVVSLRKDAANRDINTVTLVQGEDYINSGSTQQFNPRLNPSVFKVHYVRNVSMTNGPWEQPAYDPSGVIGTITGNPLTTFAKGQVNLKLNYNIRQPLGTPWHSMLQDQFTPSQRLYLISFFRGKTTEADDDPPRVDFDNLITCYNAS